MRLIIAAAALLMAMPADAAQRDRSVRNAFQRENPCPDKAVQIRPGTAGGRRGACPGWEVDHVQSLCMGGPDAVSNLQWLTVQAHKAKTRLDVKGCAMLRGARNPTLRASACKLDIKVCDWR